VTWDTTNVRRILERTLPAHLGRPCVVTNLRHKPYVYSTSFALEELDVHLDDGTELCLILKDLSPSGQLEGARAAKPSFLYEPRREIVTYRDLLSSVQMSTPTYYGSRSGPIDPWLLIEKVQGRELYQVGDIAAWQQAARYLAGMHGCVRLDPEAARRVNPYLLRYDAAFYRGWLDRASRFIDAASRRRAVPHLTIALEFALQRLSEMPTAFIHGEFYASNILVDGDSAGLRVCPVDWEMAGIGPGLLDLAALCTGWDEENRLTLARSYREGCQRGLSWTPDEEELVLLLECCQLCQAIQWLGWAPHWVAPPEHAQDWLGQATSLADRLVT